MRRVLVFALVLSFFAAVPSAHAVSRAGARKVVLRVLKKQLRHNGPTLHVLRRPVKRGARVGQGGPPARLKRVKKTAWLFWLDLAPGGGFQHPSALVLVDRKRGRVIRRQGLSWWPVLNGRRLFATDRGKRVKPRRKPRARASTVPGLLHDCIVTIGDRTDPFFLKGLAAVTGLGGRLGVKVAAATNAADLDAKVDDLANGNPRCTDVWIYIAAHGYAPPGANIPLPGGGKVAESDKPQVQIKSTVTGGQAKVENLDIDQVRRVMRGHPNLTFKLAVESCFSGRWTIATAEPNVRIVVTSSAANQVTWLAVTYAAPGHQEKGMLVYEGETQGEPDPPDAPPPFTAGLTKAIDDWAASDAERSKGEDLGKALGYAGTHRDGDRARGLGWQNGQTVDRTDERPHAPSGESGGSSGGSGGGGSGGGGTGQTTTGKPPNAQFSFSPDNPPSAPKVGETIAFDGSSSSDPDGRIVKWQWSGIPDSGGPTASASFAMPGRFPVTLKVTDDKGNTASFTQEVFVSGPGHKDADVSDVDCPDTTFNQTTLTVHIRIPSYAQDARPDLSMLGCPNATVEMTYNVTKDNDLPEDDPAGYDEWGFRKNTLNITIKLTGDGTEPPSKAGTVRAVWD